VEGIALKGIHSFLVLGMVAVAVVASAWFTLRADEREVKALATSKDYVKSKADGTEPALPRAGSTSVQDALEHPFILPFAEPTTLAEVCRHLRMVLNAPVVLDLAALKRLQITPEERVQLELHGVRLKTGLKLLLDQAGLTYRVIPEDNLLLVTDTRGSEDPLDRVLSELKSLHRDVHDLQDSVDDMRSMLGIDPDEGGPRMRKPTIIEELPGEAGDGAKATSPPSNQPSKPRS
jgi:hypothetical protein